MNVYLVRHAIAEPRDAARWPDDSRRPLTEDGTRLFRSAARGLRRLGIEVDAVLSSGYVRAWSTAGILNDVAKWPAPAELETLEPMISADECFEALRSRTESSLALVGHNPQLQLLASLMMSGTTDGSLLELRKGAVLCIRFADGVSPGTGSLRWSASPKLLRAVGR